MFKRRLIAADQASVFMEMMSDHNSSDLAPQRQMASAENNTSGPVPQCLVLYQMTSDHNLLELRIQDHINEHSSSKLVPKFVPYSSQDSYIKTRVGITILPSYSNAEDNMYINTKSENFQKESSRHVSWNR
ncbi:hypothetical protein Tco_1139955 [Tanacetum coccineum]